MEASAVREGYPYKPTAPPLLVQGRRVCDLSFTLRSFGNGSVLVVTVTALYQEDQQDDGTNDRDDAEPPVPSRLTGVVQTAYGNCKVGDDGCDGVNPNQHEADSDACGKAFCTIEDGAEDAGYEVSNPAYEEIEEIEEPEFGTCGTAREGSVLREDALYSFCKTHGELIIKLFVNRFFVFTKVIN